jgi:AraC-like DNA-binding protein
VQGIVLGPDAPHALRCEGVVVLLYLAPESALARSLRAMTGARLLRELPRDVAGPAARELDAAPLELARCLRVVRGIGGCGATAAAEAAAATATAADELPPPDPRVATVLALLASEPGRRRSLAELAAHVVLSPRRLTHLFSREVGIPIRRYAQWLRAVEAVTALARGRSQTEAALASGFADAAHMSRAFRRLFGTAPGAFAAAFLSGSRIVQDAGPAGS